MIENIFMKEQKEITFEEYLQYAENSRGNLGGELPVIVYRLLEYSLKDELVKRYGKAQEKFAVILQSFAEQEIRPYPQSFSYGIVEVEKGHGEIPLEKIIEKADAVMYEQKRCHKEAYMKELQNSLKNIL